jgi:hypothetical protein
MDDTTFEKAHFPKDIAKAAACLRFDEFCGMVFELCNTPAHQPSLTAWIFWITGYHWISLVPRFEILRGVRDVGLLDLRDRLQRSPW